jgi:hypothetical protein
MSIWSRGRTCRPFPRVVDVAATANGAGRSEYLARNFIADCLRTSPIREGVQETWTHGQVNFDTSGAINCPAALPWRTDSLPPCLLRKASDDRR